MPLLEEMFHKDFRLEELKRKGTRYTEKCNLLLLGGYEEGKVIPLYHKFFPRHTRSLLIRISPPFVLHRVEKFVNQDEIILNFPT